MSKKLFATAVFALMLLAGAGIAAAGTQDFTLVNDTGVDIAELYIAPSASEDWEEDVLGTDILKDGASVHVTFSPKLKAEAWDLMVVDAEGDEITWTGLELNQISKITLHFENGTPTATLE